jgi:hypothetical protein
MLRLCAVALVALTLLACETPLAPASPSVPGVALARLGDPPPPPEDAEILGSFGEANLLRTSDLSLGDEPASVTGPLEFSLDGRYFVGGGGDNGWLQLSSSTDNVTTLSSPRITFRAGSGTSGSGIIKVLFDQGSLRIDLASDIAGATFSQTCAAGGAPCAVIDIVGADFLDLDGAFTEINGTLVVVAEISES